MIVFICEDPIADLGDPLHGHFGNTEIDAFCPLKCVWKLINNSMIIRYLCAIQNY